MALDAANFISELSIVDPPGTDPLSQGDDQIRTTKRAVQQSFPLIAAAVNISDVQMNLMAIKNEANIFTTEQTLQDANLVIDMVVDSTKVMNWRRAGITRWQFRMEADAGNNDFALQRRDVLGATLDQPWTVSAVTGIVDFAQPPTVLGAPLWIAGEIRMFAITAVPGMNWFLADGLNGTVDLTDRALIGTGVSAVGVALPPNLVGTAAAGTTGGTAISVAQMPVHGHDIRTGVTPGGVTDVTISAVSTETVVGGNRSNPTGSYIRNNSTGNAVVRNEGSGDVHTHSSPSQAVTENGTGRDTVRPLSRVVQMFQYVP